MNWDNRYGFPRATVEAGQGASDYRSSLVASGRASSFLRAQLRRARESCAELMGAERAEEVFWTSTAECGARWALQQWRKRKDAPGRHLLVTPLESPRFEALYRELAAWGAEVVELPLDCHGLLAPAELERALERGGVLAWSHPFANGVTGEVYDLSSCSQVARRHGIPLIGDGSLLTGWWSLKELWPEGQVGVCLGDGAWLGAAEVGCVACHGWWREGGGTALEELGFGGGAGRVQEVVELGNLVEQVQVEARAAGARVGQEILHASLLEVGAEWVGPPPGGKRLPYHVGFVAEGVDAEALLLRLELRGWRLGATGLCGTRRRGEKGALERLGYPAEWDRWHVVAHLPPDVTREQAREGALQITAAIGYLRQSG